MKYLVAGLGNIGPEYELTRHNIGFLTLDRLADEKGSSFEVSRHAFVSLIRHKGRQVYLIKPTTYMNLSGKAIKYWLNELKIQVENLLVVVDDIALPFGTLRMREKGSSAGHNGLANIELMLGTHAYPRLRMGIGDDFSKGRQVDYVLSPFSGKEIEELPFIMDRANEGILSFCTIGAHQTMMKINKRSSEDQ